MSPPEMPPPNRVSIVVVNWNRADLLAECLESLRGQTFRDFELIVVDNGSQDASREVVRAFDEPPPRLIENAENRGFCAANNQGITAAQGEYVVLLNNDAQAAPRWLESLVRAADQDPRIGMAASKILVAEDPRVIDKVGHLIYPDGQNRGRGHGERDEGQYDRDRETAWPDGCAALYRKEMLDQIGGFDEQFFAYADDAELGLRGRIAGWRAVYVPEAVVRHRRGETLGRYSEKRLFLIERNRIWLVAKLFPLRMWPAAPVYYLFRLLAGAWTAAAGRGDAAQAAAELSLPRLIQCLMRANLAALAGLPEILRKRRQVRAFRRLSPSETAALLRRYRMPLADLVGRTA